MEVLRAPFGETRAAAKARGLERSPRALLVPFALRTVSHAQLTGEALAVALTVQDPLPPAAPRQQTSNQDNSTRTANAGTHKRVLRL